MIKNTYRDIPQTSNQYKAHGRLWGSSTYLIGGIDFVPDGGVGWRQKITEPLQRMGIVALNPCQKPIDIGLENIENRQYRENLKACGGYEQLSHEMRLVRAVDLRMVDFSSFVIVHLDNRYQMTGTIEEIADANRKKRPIIIHSEQGKNAVPDWVFGMCPHELFFGNWDEIIKYIEHINWSPLEEIDTLNGRWMFFNFKQMLPKHVIIQDWTYDETWK
jgi:hypothetical protein